MLFLDIFCYNKKTELTYLSLCRGQQGMGGCVCVCARARAQLCLTLCDPWTVAREAPLAMEFSRQEYQNGLPFSFPGDLPNPDTQPMSLASPILAGAFLAALLLVCSPFIFSMTSMVGAQ